ncbi:MAG: DEAD/DEAH box helicase [Gammaproteobacteria bacterium]|uniref:ATP-dependent RNA helicase DeaD n=1 Tax=Shewanella vaxholmensis TaxID=3063535 RepID=A0ABU9UY05_9GAMM|nr:MULTISPECIES: DEAD/DEAH box helicase [unclassified Shewanella]EGT3627420.1 DEAD/DEAH box helicase [Morganella morganii]MBU1391420.1 DEAD/DEAH box helicase [Gammaproteobacteria bacterium]QYX65327.1 DEAD/DEAH box helicase [Shewanella putrefaciens]MBU1477841.1 DEAD/DEAH box helicase [Gammaproteobacteria bacterium]MBU2001172.1 DEAD/DEAH box helicase [Gammaproteobacteria bacterium]
MSSDERTFRELGLSENLLRALDELGYEKPTPIQSASIDPLMAGKDILGQAQTGTGKTGAFALPLLNKVTSQTTPQILVLAPTRELAVQVAEAFSSYAKFMKNFHVLPIYGGQSMQQQLNALKRGPQVIVGTPGRVMDHMRRGTLKLDSLKALVLDEADEMLKMGFIDDIEWILEHTPSERQLALFSATMPEQIKRVANQHLRSPVHVRIESSQTTVESIEQRFVQVSQHNKLEALVRVLEVENTEGVIIFVRTRNSCVELAEKLEARGYASSPLHGDMNQQARERAVDQLKRGKLDILIATDVAARGLDVERIGHVVNYDIPYDAEAYVHRIGRTGRAGRTGMAILFVTSREMRMLRTIERSTNSRISPMKIPSPETVAERRLSRLGEQLAETINGDLDFMKEAVAQLCQQLEVDTDLLAAALLHQVQQERPLQLPAIQERARDERSERTDRGSERSDRGGERGERRSREPRPMPASLGTAEALKDNPDLKMCRYVIDVGRENGVGVGNIVGAIANEANIDSRYIGAIQLYDAVTTVDLPDGMPKDVLQHLRKVRVCGKPLNIREAGDQVFVDSGRSARSDRPAGDRKPRGDRPAGDRKPRAASTGDKPFADRKPRADKPAGERKPRKPRED